MLSDIKTQTQLSFESVQSRLQSKGSFEIFGFDFLVDSDYGTWLIEINTNPCLDDSTPLLSQLIPRMVNDTLKLTLDQVFLPKKGQPSYCKQDLSAAFPVDGYEDDFNLWECVQRFDGKIVVPSKPPVAALDVD